MHPEEIKAAMRIAGKTLVVVAEELKLDKSTISSVVCGRGKSARVQQYISVLLNKPVDTIWPPTDRPVLRRVKSTTRKTA
ncbi:hypothetical protein HBDW_25960 [Herbaspirillum sp. DW155]|uniref:helix-turn-helix domain-containing protein n=1 Tax=Herbaspirillum sp. DW155 TaxID=3095609 RepID=UPI00308A9491|nr:hypothetical protein HBDW_25960 [Herbaspirillum sp. DW155]